MGQWSGDVPVPEPCWLRSRTNVHGADVHPEAGAEGAQQEAQRGPKHARGSHQACKRGETEPNAAGTRQVFLSEGKEMTEEGAGRRGAQAIMECPEQQEYKVQAALTIAGV